MHPPDPLQLIDDAVRRVRAGEREAYRIVLDACETRLRLLVASILPNASTVEDVVQQAFVAAYRKLDQYQTGTGFMSWIATIARYEALNERRRWLSERAFRQRYGDEVRIERAAQDQGDLLGVADETTLARLRACIDGLREGVGEVIDAHYFQQLGNDEIAARHGRTAAWVRLVLHRARLAIADCLKAKQGAGCVEP